MFDFQQKNKLRKILYSPIIVSIVLLIAVYSLYSTYSIYKKMRQTKADMEKSEQTLLALETKNQELNSQINQLQTEQGVEKEIRTKFGEALPGESMAVIVPDSDESSQSASTTQSLWARFLNFFGL